MPLDYSYGGSSIVSQLSNACADNQPIIQGPLARIYWRIERSIDLQAKLLGQVAWMFGSSFAPKSRSERLAFGLYHKTILGNFAALHLLTQGLFGPARPLLRHAFESYVLAKFFIVAEDETLARRWEQAELYVLGREVFRKLRSPDVEPLTRFWGFSRTTPTQAFYRFRARLTSVSRVTAQSWRKHWPKWRWCCSAGSMCSTPT